METRKEVNKQPKTYTYPQTTVLRTASSSGSNLDRHGGSILNRRQQSGLIEYAPDTRGVPYTGYVSVVPLQPTEQPSMTAWQLALSSAGVQGSLIDALLPSHAAFEDLDTEDLALLAAGLRRIAEETHSPKAFGFSISARNLLASSKVLDRLSPRARRLLGVDRNASTPRYVVIAGASGTSSSRVLLVENSTTFEMAVASGWHECVTLVAAYGYGLNIMSDSSAGWALVDSIAGGRCQVLSRAGADHDVESLLRRDHLFFWGDLDREGLRIALALRAHLPQLKLSALYEPMCAMVGHRSTSHSYSSISGKSAQAPWRESGDGLLDRLAALCSSRAVDQESVDLEACREMAERPLAALRRADNVSS